MSMQRLARVVAQAVAPAGRPVPAAALPAFDTPAAIATATLRAGLAVGPPTRRAMPPQLPEASAQAIPARIAVPPVAPRPSVVAAAPKRPPAFNDEAPVMTGVNADQPRVSQTGSSPPRGADAATPMQAPDPVVHVEAINPLAATLLPVPVDDKPKHGPARDAADERAEPVARAEPVIAVPAPEDPMPERPLPLVRPFAASPVDAQRTHVAPALAEPSLGPSISIGSVEVVLAPPPQRPASPPRSAPDRGFARYAAMRGARDRAW